MGQAGVKPTTLDQETGGSRKETAPDVCECEQERTKQERDFLLENLGRISDMPNDTPL